MLLNALKSVVLNTGKYDERSEKHTVKINAQKKRVSGRELGKRDASTLRLASRFLLPAVPLLWTVGWRDKALFRFSKTTYDADQVIFL